MSSFFWRCVGFGCLWALWQVCSSIYVLDAWPLPFTWLKIASAGGVAFVGGCFTYARDPESAFGRSPVMTKMIIIFVLLSALLGLSGCSGLALLNQNNTEDQTRAILEMQNARGCIYFNGSAAPWASVKTVIVGTWGQNPPSYAECWKGLPPGM